MKVDTRLVLWVLFVFLVPVLYREHKTSNESKKKRQISLNLNHWRTYSLENSKIKKQNRRILKNKKMSFKKKPIKEKISWPQKLKSSKMRVTNFLQINFLQENFSIVQQLLGVSKIKTIRHKQEAQIVLHTRAQRKKNFGTHLVLKTRQKHKNQKQKKVNSENHIDLLL